MLTISSMKKLAKVGLEMSLLEELIHSSIKLSLINGKIVLSLLKQLKYQSLWRTYSKILDNGDILCGEDSLSMKK